MSIQRYNQGFGKFGPMEKCNSGEWCKYNDAMEENESIQSTLWKLFDKEFHWWQRTVVSVVAAMTGWGIVEIFLVFYAFNGHL